MRSKFVELSVVTDESIEEAVNRWVREGWQFDGIRFVTTEASRRPSMAFVSFVRADDAPAAPRAEALAEAEPAAADHLGWRAPDDDRDDDPDLRLAPAAPRRTRRQPRRPR
jgi:hypothetical protein